VDKKKTPKITAFACTNAMIRNNKLEIASQKYPAFARKIPNFSHLMHSSPRAIRDCGALFLVVERPTS